jgi:putative PIN family toxin of toxin-antitoxin system
MFTERYPTRSSSVASINYTIFQKEGIHVKRTNRWPVLPACCDPNDQVFLALAVITKADALVTGDKDLLVLADEFQIPIVTLAEFMEIIALSE